MPLRPQRLAQFELGITAQRGAALTESDGSRERLGRELELPNKRQQSLRAKDPNSAEYLQRLAQGLLRVAEAQCP